MNATRKIRILTDSRLSRLGCAAMVAGVLALALAWPGTVLADDVTLNANSALTGGVSMVSTPVISTNGTGTGSAANPWVYVFAPNIRGIPAALDRLVTPRLREGNFVLNPMADGIAVDPARFQAVADWVREKGRKP